VRSALALIAIALCAAAGARAQILPAGDCAGVYWDLTASFTSGDRVYARVLVTRAGPGDLNAAGVGYWIAPDGTQTHFQNGRGEGEFEWSEAGDRVRIGSTRLDVGAGETSFQVDNDKRGVKLRVAIEALRETSTAPIFAGDPEVDVLALGLAATGHVWRTGMVEPRKLRGAATLVRTRHGACESDRSALRIDLHHLASDGALLLIHERLADGAQRNWLGWHTPRGPLRTLRPETIALEDWRPEPEGPPLPHRLSVSDRAVRGAVAIGASHLSIDPLEALPRLVRMLYWFGARPRRIWADATSELASGASDALPRGAAIASFSFLRPPETNRQETRDSGE
jgi:hypothetical protein